MPVSSDPNAISPFMPVWGILRAMTEKRFQDAQQQNPAGSFISGSNNAGGLMPNAPTSAAPSGVRGSFGMLRPNGQGGVYRGGSATSPMNSMPQNGGNTVNAESPFNSQPVSFAAGGMMTEQGTAVRPGMPMPPSAGTGRTLPSARFEVKAQPPQFGGTAPAPTDEPQLGAAGPAQVDPAQIEQEAQRFVQQHPQEMQKIQEVIAVAMQTGELTPEELNMAVQLAKTALASPESYPQIRQFAIQNGLGTEQDIPQQMDQGLLYVLIVAGKSMQPNGNAMQGQGPSPTQQPKPGSVVPEYKDGGMTGDKTHIAKLHAREYVIPEDALIYHGKKHFDKLVEQARTPPDDGTN